MSHLAPERLEELASLGGADPHLDSCAECSQAILAARARRKLLTGLKQLTLTPAAFARVEAKVMSEVTAGTTGWGLVLSQLRSNWTLVAGVVALALLVAVPRLLEKKPQLAPVAAKTLQKAAPSPQQAVQLLAVLVEGSVLRNGVALVAGDPVKTFDSVDARKGRAVLVEVGQPVQLELMGQARFGGEATVSLQEGLLAIDSASRVLVEAGGAWLGGADVALVVSHAAAEVVVDVLRGQGWVGSDSALRDAVSLNALAELQIPLPVQRPFGHIGRDPAPYPFTPQPAGPWAKLDLSDLPPGTRFDVEGQQTGGTPASLLLSLGRHRVRTQLPGQLPRDGWVELVAGTGARFKLPPRKEPEEDAVPMSDEVIAVLRQVIKAQTPKLQACYEKWLKANPAATGRAELTLVVAKDGKVIAARVEEATIPKESIDCLVRTGKTFKLPALGSEQEIQVPLVMSPGGR